MKHWIFIWNPKIFDIHKCLTELGFVEWRITNAIERIQEGDQVFLYGSSPVKRILYRLRVTATGIACQDIHNRHCFQETEEFALTDSDFFCKLEVTDCLSLDNPFFSWDNLKVNGFRGYNLGSKVLKGSFLDYLLNTIESDIPMNMDGSNIYSEGASRISRHISYERNPMARAICLLKKGYACRICGFDFETTYGEVGKEFIHVHHINPLAENGGTQTNTDPSKDLIPVCPNCHAMLHRKINGKTFSTNELSLLVANQRNIMTLD